MNGHSVRVALGEDSLQHERDDSTDSFYPCFAKCGVLLAGLCDVDAAVTCVRCVIGDSEMDGCGHAGAHYGYCGYDQDIHRRNTLCRCCSRCAKNCAENA